MQKHYRSLKKAEDFSKRKMILVAKATIHEEGPDMENERNRLRKNKSTLTAEIEDNFDAALKLIESSTNSPALDDAIRIISPEHLLTTLSPEQEQKRQRNSNNVQYFQEKMFQETQRIIERIFSFERMKRVVDCIFRHPSTHELDEEEKKYRVVMADYLIKKATRELQHYLPAGYTNFLSEDLERATELSGAIRWNLESNPSRQFRELF